MSYKRTSLSMPEQRAAGDPQTDRTVARRSRLARLQHAAIAGKYWEELFRYMGGAGVPSDHLSTTTKKTDIGGKVLSCGYESGEMYQ